MTIHKLYLGSVGPFLFNDEDDIDDPENDFQNQKQRAIVTNFPLGAWTQLPIEDRVQGGQLTDADWLKLICVDSQQSETLILPTITAQHRGKWIGVARTTSSELIVQAPVGTKIASSPVGGKLICANDSRQGAWLVFFALTLSQYSPGWGYGKWQVAA